MELESDLRRAVARDQLRLVYQPQVEGIAIFDAVVQLARSLGVRALAEGLGSDEVARLLAAPVDLAA